MEELLVKDLHAAYVKKEVLKGISLSARAGEIVTIVGPNGSGKSTMLKVIAGFLRPSCGAVWLGGRDITPLAPHERARQGLAYFMQGGRIFLNLTVAENLALASMATGRNGQTGAFDEAYDIFPLLKEYAHKRGGLLSGGERHALALAMTTLAKPRLLLLDEPTAGLSPALVKEMLAKVSDINAALKTTVLLVEHNLHEALRISQRAVVLVRGEVVYETEHPQQDITVSRMEQFFWAAGG